MMPTVLVRALTVEDRLALWEWRRDPMTSALFGAGPDVDYGQHRRWFDRTMESADALWCVGVVETLRIGCARFDHVRAEEYEMSWFLKPAYAGKGYATALVREAVAFARIQRRISLITAYVPAGNPACASILREANFLVTGEGRVCRGELAREMAGVAAS